MKQDWKVKICVALLAVFVSFGCGLSADKAEAATGDQYMLQISGYHNYDGAAELLEYVNQARVADGAKALTMDKELTDAALQRAAELAYYFDHTRPDGSVCTTACSSGRMVGENIALGSPDPYYTYLQWWNSPGHKRNMLDSRYKTIGIAHYCHNGVDYWVQAFGTTTGTKETRTGQRYRSRKIEIVERTSPLVFIGLDGSASMTAGEKLDVQIGAKNEDFGSLYCVFKGGSFNWVSSNTDVVTVDSEGNLTAVSPGSAVITATVKDSTVRMTLQVDVKYNFYNVTVSPIWEQYYTGSAICPKPEVYDGGKLLTAGIDYTVSYGNNVDAGYADIKLTGIGAYSGTKNDEFYINPRNVETDAKLSLSSWNYGSQDIRGFLYDNVVVTVDGKTLNPYQDYSIEYYVGRSDTCIVTVYEVRFLGNYTGYKKAKCLEDAILSEIAMQQYTGKAVTPAVSAYLFTSAMANRDAVLTEGVDYRVEYSNNVNAGTATVKLLPLGDNYGSATATFVIAAPEYKVSFVANGGSVKTKSKSVTNGKKYGTLPKPTRKGYAFSGWYTAAKKGKKVTSATVCKLSGNQKLYAHWKKISVGKASLKSVKKRSGRKMKVTIKSVKNVSGYQVVIAGNKKFTKNKKTLTGKSTVKNFTKLKKGKYYVKVRAYKVDSAGKRVYGSYSNTKMIRI